MKQLKRELSFWAFSVLLGWAIKFIPKDAVKTWQWVARMPIED